MVVSVIFNVSELENQGHIVFVNNLVILTFNLYAKIGISFTLLPQEGEAY